MYGAKVDPSNVLDDCIDLKPFCRPPMVTRVLPRTYVTSRVGGLEVHAHLQAAGGLGVAWILRAVRRSTHSV